MCGGIRETASADALAAAAPVTVDVAGAIHLARMDVGDDASVSAAVAGVLATTGGRVNVAVAVTSNGGRTTIEGVVLSDYVAVVIVNFFGGLRLIQAVAPSVRRGGAGRMLGVSSVTVLIGFPFFGAYVASKSSMDGSWESNYAEHEALGVHFIVERLEGCQRVWWGNGERLRVPV